jgi:hypothetical protein
MYGDQADGASLAHFAETLDHARGLQAQPVVRERLGKHDLTLLGTAVFAGRHNPFGPRAPIRRKDAAMPVDAKNATRCIGEAP